jgi:hypothetical protein
MKKLRRDTRGQFVVIAALLIAVLTLSLALSIHELNLNRQQLRYEPVEELILGITSDFDRCLTHVLSIASQEYNRTRSFDDASRKGEEFMSKWNNSIIISYAHLGVKISTRLLWDENSFKWGNLNGWSSINALLNLDVDAYGFKGWVGTSAKYVNLHILPDSIEPGDKNITVKFEVSQGKNVQKPIPNLQLENLKNLEIWIDTTSGGSARASITELKYLGNGIYSVTFAGTISRNIKRIRLLAVTPEDNICVEAYFEPQYPENVFVTLQSQEENSTVPTNLGKILLGDTVYTLPNSTINPGTQLGLRYFPEDGYSFLNWTITGSATVGNETSAITNVSIYGNCTLTAFYRKTPAVQPEIVELTIDSREINNSTQNLGSITFNSTNYTDLPITIPIPEGDYMLQYLPHNESYVFLWWEYSGNIIVRNTSKSNTKITINGNAKVTAVYGSEPVTTTPLSVTLQSLEETLASKNLGQIQLGGSIFTPLPATTTVNNGTYGIKYTPSEGYTFLNWTTSEGIHVEDPYSPQTMVTISDNGTITAFYSGCNILLDSIAWDGSSHSLGSITLGSNTYTRLPKTLTGLPRGDYMLQYLPHNESYVFLWWEYSGNIIVWDTSKSSTSLTVLGDGTILAVYGVASGPPPPNIGDWSTLYVDTGYTLVPPFMMSGKSSHLPSRYSTGTGKEIAWCTSPPTPELHLASLVNVTVYLRINPYWNVKDVTLELGFNYDGKYYLLGSTVFPVHTNETYSMTIDIFNGEFPYGYFGIIPEGSEVVLIVTVTFFKQPWGTLFLYYGPNRPSRVELF